MKLKTLTTILILSSLALTSCIESNSTSVSSSHSGGSSEGGVSGGGGNGNGGSSGGGDNDSGGDNGTRFPIRYYEIKVAGEGTGKGGNLEGDNTWKPYGNYDGNTSEKSSFFPKIVEANALFRSDNKLDVRFKLKPQLIPQAGKKGCYGRATGQARDGGEYSKVKFNVSLRDVFCDDTTSDSNNCRLGDRYHTTEVGPLSVGSYSEILKLGPYRHREGSNINGDIVDGVVVEVHGVKTDQTCQYNDQRCEADQYLRTSSCWQATMYFATDYTESF